MDWWLLIQAFILGIVEGLTEFLPVSSTGHLIVVADLIGFQNDGRVFEIAIQFGAILAIVFEYRQRFTSVATGMFSDSKAQKFILNLLVAFLPAAVIGLLFISLIKQYLFNPITVAVMLILGGLGTAYAIFAFIGMGSEPFMWALALAAVGAPIYLLMHRHRKR